MPASKTKRNDENSEVNNAHKTRSLNDPGDQATKKSKVALDAPAFGSPLRSGAMNTRRASLDFAESVASAANEMAVNRAKTVVPAKKPSLAAANVPVGTKMSTINRRASHASASANADAKALESLKKEVATLSAENKELHLEHASWKEKLAASVTMQDDLKEEMSRLESTLNEEAAALAQAHETTVAAWAARVRELEETNEAQAKQLDERAVALAKLRASSAEADQLRRDLHNQIQDLKGNIRVFCRVRPLLPREVEAAAAAAERAAIEAAKNAPVLKGAARRASVAAVGVGSCSEGVGSTSASAMAVNVATGLEPKKLKVDNKHDFAFDRVFAPSTSQGAVFEDVGDLVTSVLDGYNACVLAYGQTGSGKTYTMEGGLTHDNNDNGSSTDVASTGTESVDAELGIIPRSVAKLFGAAHKMHEEQGWVTEISVSHLEIYNDEIRDLLAASGAGSGGGGGNCSSSKLGGMSSVKHDFSSGTTHVANLSSHSVADAAAVQQLLRTAAANRSVAATKMNARSSRSHAVFWLKVASRHPASGASRTGGLSLVDLAGSERVEASGVVGEQLKEALAINKSLSSLGNVVRALAQKQAHVPFRDSTLTYLLQTCLGGNAKCLMLVNVSPAAANTSETLCSLRFAQKVNSTVTGVAKKHATAASTPSSSSASSS